MKETAYCEAEWYDREGSRLEFLSLSPHSMYLPGYLLRLIGEEPFVKAFAAAFTMVLMAASSAYRELFMVCLWFWAGDMFFGLLRVGREALKPKHLRQESFRWSRLGDGLLRLGVLFVLPGLLAMVGVVITDVLGALSTLGVDVVISERIGAGLATIALSLILVDEITSVLDNAVKLSPGRLGRLITWTKGGEIEERAVEVVVLEEGNQYGGPYRRKSDSPQQEEDDGALG